jgi:hypothetical protein
LDAPQTPETRKKKMEKRYQVFVSSTFADLQDERQEVMQALLELDCIPAGMELFPAANEDQWTLIKKVIDDCDYYIVIVAGRYGSLGTTGQSYTEMEYRYALDKGKPVIGFLHKDPTSLAEKHCEHTEDGKKRLTEFREFVKKKMCRFWDSPADLGSQVSRSLIKLIKSNPAVGWVRGDLVPDVPAAEEILKLRNQIGDLEKKLAAASTVAPAGTQSLSQGDEKYPIAYKFKAHPPGTPYYNATAYNHTIEVSWDDIFATLSPLMIDEASDGALKTAFDELIEREAKPVLAKDKNVKNLKHREFVASMDDFQTIKVQFRALGLIAKSTKSRSVKDTVTYWTLTPYGDTLMTRLRAIERDELPVAEEKPAEEKKAAK